MTNWLVALDIDFKREKGDDIEIEGDSEAASNDNSDQDLKDGIERQNPRKSSILGSDGLADQNCLQLVEFVNSSLNSSQFTIYSSAQSKKLNHSTDSSFKAHSECSEKQAQC